MQTTHRSIFTTITTEGAILPADLLGRIAEGSAAVKGLTAADYHLAPGEKLNEATSRAWNRLLGVWTAFRPVLERLPPGDPGTTETRERWLLPLFQELGYGRLPAARAQEVEGRSYPISHGWGQVPIHLVGAGVDLDRPTRGVAGAARSSPHSLLQEFLNASDDHLWGFVGNGRWLRILRDNSSLTRQAYVECDLQAMMDGEVYSDFVLLWLLGHQSRLEGEKPAECWLERWSRAAHEAGTRALDRLRDGVAAAIAALGRGFLAHEANRALRDRLRAGTLNGTDYYRQLLRLVYRLIFLFVAEDRDLLLDPAAAPAAGQVYADYYSTARLRRLAIRQRGSRHADLYQALRFVMQQLGNDSGCPALGLPPLNSFLFQPGADGAVPDLEGAELANHDLLDAVRELAYTVDGGVRRPVDYRNLGAEELGSVYESLLELHPALNVDARTFALRTAGGHERKTTGSYYTPTSLITALLDSALDPVLEEAARQPNPERAILDLKVCDPACGSGHFLIAAAHRIARRLARVRTGDDEPAPAELRKALRQVIGRCLYGVDLNPMALELCKVSLWMEAVEPGKPLSFLDHHIQVGNSLLGATPALLQAGIPDAAFEPITGDDKAVCSEYRRRNREERKGVRSLFDYSLRPWEQLGNLATALLSLDAIPDDTVAGVRRKQEQYEELVHSSGYLAGGLLADTWCAAFVWKKTGEWAYPITEQIFRRIEHNPFDLAPWMRDEIARLAQQYRFFHWHLAFPDVFRVPAKGAGPDNEQAGWSGGFDVVLGNPPWERIKIQEQEWFAACRPDIAAAPNAAARKRMIGALKTEDPALWAAFQEAVRQAEGESHLVRDSGRFPLCGRGDVNTYSIFAETNRLILGPAGRVGCIVPTGIATDDTTKFFFQDLMSTRALVSLYSFENEEFIFPAVHHATKFCLLTLSGINRPVNAADFLFFARQTSYLHDEERHFALSLADLALLNPNTRTAPIFRSQRDTELTKTIYRRVPVLIKEGPPEENPWGIRFMTMFHMANDSGLFRTREQLEAEGWRLEGNVFRRGDDAYLPLYEAKLLHQFTHRWATYMGTATRDLSPAELVAPARVVQPRYWVPRPAVEGTLAGRWDRGWLLGFRDIARSTDERAAIFSLLPRVGVGNKVPLVLLPHQITSAMGASFLTAVDSYVFDYVSRQKLGGTSFSYFLLKQLPVFPPATYEQPAPWAPGGPLRAWLLPRALELTYTAWDLAPFARDCGYGGPPFRWDEERRFLLRCELDAAYFHLYGIARDDVDYIMETFPIVRRRDEAVHGEYRTKRVILEVYDAMQQGPEGTPATGQPYVTRLDPPPAPGFTPGAVPAPRAADPVPTSAAPPMPASRVAAAPAARSAAPSRPVALPPTPAPPPAPARPMILAESAPPVGAPTQPPLFDAPTALPFAPGDRVRHPTFGMGRVVDVRGGGADQVVTVAFAPPAGPKRLMARVAGLARVE